MLVSGLVLLGSLTRESGPVEAQTSGVRLGLPALWRRPRQPGCPWALGCPGEQAPLCPRLYAEDALRSPGTGIRVRWGTANQRDWNRTTLLLVWDPRRAPVGGARPRVGSWLSAAPDTPLGLALAGHSGVPRPQGHSSGPHLEEPGSGRCALPYPCPRQPVAQTASSSLQTTTAPEHQLGGSCKHTPGTRASPPVPGEARRFEHMQGPRPRCSGPRGCTCADGWCTFLPKACGAADGSLVRARVVRCACTRVQAELTRVYMVLTHTCACLPSPGTHTWMWAKRDPGLNKVKQGL